MYRILSQKIEDVLFGSKPKIVLLLGLRQTGKTTLAKMICSRNKFQLFDFGLASDREEFLTQNRHSLAVFAKRYQNQVILIDEVQKLPEATSVIKHLHDHYHFRFLLTGSSELKIKEQTGDSLAGRTMTFRLYPLSIEEILVQQKLLKPRQKPIYDEAQSVLQKYLVFGSLPNLENISADGFEIYLKDFVDALLSKDVLEVARIRKSTKIFTLAKLLAMQLGQLVNVNEIATLVELSRPSIYNYLDLLEQLNIIIRAYPLSTTRRRAISEKFKVYFTDLGLRNSLLNNFEKLETRIDRGAILENAVYVGLKRKLDYAGKPHEMGFFRTARGKEIDLVVKSHGAEKLYEVKFSEKFQVKKGNLEYVTYANASSYL